MQRYFKVKNVENALAVIHECGEFMPGAVVCAVRVNGWGRRWVIRRYFNYDGTNSG